MRPEQSKFGRNHPQMCLFMYGNLLSMFSMAPSRYFLWLTQITQLDADINGRHVKQRSFANPAQLICTLTTHSTYSQINLGPKVQIVVHWCTNIHHLGDTRNEITGPNRLQKQWLAIPMKALTETFTMNIHTYDAFDIFADKLML